MPDYRHVLLAVAAEVGELEHAGYLAVMHVTAIEQRVLGGSVSSGGAVLRKKFWEFVRQINHGVIPMDIRVDLGIDNLVDYETKYT